MTSHSDLHWPSTPAPGPWRLDAACREHPVELFFPARDLGRRRRESTCNEAVEMNQQAIHNELTRLFPLRSTGECTENTGVSFTEICHVVRCGQVHEDRRVINCEAKRCFCGTVFPSRGRRHIFCSSRCKSRAKYFRKKARAAR